MNAAARKMHGHMVAIHELDLSRLPEMARLGAHCQRLNSGLAMVVAAGEVDARRKLRLVRLPGDGPGKARARAWLITRGLRLATAALRMAQAQAVAYRVELDQRFIMPARGANRRAGGGTQNRGGQNRGGTWNSGGFDILGGS